MLEQTGNNLTYYAMFIDVSTHLPINNVTPTVVFYRFDKSLGTASLLGGVPPVNQLGSTGVYWVTLASPSVNAEGDYICVFSTTGNAYFKSIMQIYTVGRGVKLLGTKKLTELLVVPPADPTFEQALMLPYEAIRNKTTTTAGELKIHNNAGAGLTKATLQDDGTTLTRNQLGSP